MTLRECNCKWSSSNQEPGRGQHFRLACAASGGDSQISAVSLAGKDMLGACSFVACDRSELLQACLPALPSDPHAAWYMHPLTWHILYTIYTYIAMWLHWRGASATQTPSTQPYPLNHVRRPPKLPVTKGHSNWAHAWSKSPFGGFPSVVDWIAMVALCTPSLCTEGVWSTLSSSDWSGAVQLPAQERFRWICACRSHTHRVTAKARRTDGAYHMRFGKA